MVLLGAGASVEAGVPGSFAMAQRIATHFRSHCELERYSRVISFAIGGLIFQRGIQGDDPFKGVDVEELFSAVQLLAERHTLEAAPFIGSWHAMVDEFDKRSPYPARLDRLYNLIYKGITQEIIDAFPKRAPSFAGKDIDRKLETLIQTNIEAATKNRRARVSSFDAVSRAIGEFVVDFTNGWLKALRSRKPRADHAFGRELSKAIAAQQAQPGEGEIFQATSIQMIQALKQIVWIDAASRVEYLAPLVKLLSIQGQLTIATLNYDNGIERLAEARGVVCDTGIERWSEIGTFESKTRDLFLLKLHGSIDWALETEQITSERPMPHSRIRRVNPDQVRQDEFTPAIIFGQRNKLTAEGPFLDLLRAFQQELMKNETLTVIGYSFRDPHINEYLSQWLNADPDHQMRIISPRFSESRVEYARALQQYVSERMILYPKKASEGIGNLW